MCSNGGGEVGDVQDFRGRTRWTVEAYNGGSQTATSNRRTSYEYDGSGHVVSVKAFTGTATYQ